MGTHTLTDSRTHARTAQPGFTIIETMLVLAITGLLIAGLLVGLGSAVSNQRYLDAVSSLKNLLQDQYSQVNNVTNSRTANWTCANAAPVEQPTGGTAPGQSDCVLLGRYIGIVNDQITTATVVGSPQSTTSSSGTIDSIKNNYTLGISPSSAEKTTLEWGAQIAWPVAGGGSQPKNPSRSLAILMIRSPENGTSYTFTSDNNSANDISTVTPAVLSAMMVSSLTATNPGQGARTVCLDPGGFAVPEKLAVYVAAGASGPSSIEVRTKALTVAAGGDTQC